MNRSGKALWVATLTFAFVASAIAVVPARADTKSFTLYGGMSTGWGFSSASQSNQGPTVIVIQSPPTFELYGDGIRGWGLQNTTTGITKPGPTLVVNQSQTITIDVHSADGMLHSWFIDLNNDKTQQATEPHSNDTASSTRYTYTARLM